MSNNPSFTVISLGCSKNQVDSEIMISSLETEGLIFTEETDNADIIIVNTCGFIEKAKEESIDTTLQAKNSYPDKIVIMAGCLNQRYNDKFKELMPEIDGFLESRNPLEITKLVQDILTIKCINLKPNNNSHGHFTPRRRFISFPGSSYVKIGDGCDNNCTYCAIPIIKGRLVSREINSILEEIEFLKKQDIFEFNIIAQDIGSFGKDKGNENLPALLKEISRTNGEFWIRLLYIHPDHFPLDIIEIIKKDKRILPYFDIPFQHGSPDILKAMGRNSDVNANLDLVKKIRDILPGSVIRSTFLLGFPGEEERDFEALLEFQQKASFDWLGSFTYSREEGTKSFDLKNRVKKSLMKNRQKEVEENQINITENRLKRFINNEEDILIEEEVEKEDLYLGRAYFNAPEVDGLVVVKSDIKLVPGSIIRAKLEKLNGVDFEASFIK